MKKSTVYIVFDSENSRKLQEDGEIPMICVDSESFDTYEEAQAFMKGFELAQGWDIPTQIHENSCVIKNKKLIVKY